MLWANEFQVQNEILWNNYRIKIFKMQALKWYLSCEYGDLPLPTKNLIFCVIFPLFFIESKLAFIRPQKRQTKNKQTKQNNNNKTTKKTREKTKTKKKTCFTGGWTFQVGSVSLTRAFFFPWWQKWPWKHTHKNFKSDIFC